MGVAVAGGAGIGAGGCCCWALERLRALATFSGRFSDAAASSLDDDSSRRGRGGGGSELAELLDGRGEKLPGALAEGLAGCMMSVLLRVRLARPLVTSCESASASARSRCDDRLRVHQEGAAMQTRGR